MSIAKKLRISTTDSSDAMEIACSEVESAVGVPVQAEFQEIDGPCLILELRVADGAAQTLHSDHLAAKVEGSASKIELLSSWNETSVVRPKACFCHDVLGVEFDALPAVARRALQDRLPTAKWERLDGSWHLAAPAVCGEQVIVGLLHRRGYLRRFAALDVAALRRGLAS